MRSIGVQNDNSFALVRPDTVTSITLSTLSQTISVPAGATHAFFAATQNFAATYSSSASPTQTAAFTSAATTGCEINPTVRFLGKNQVPDIGVIGAAAGFLSVAWYNSGST